MRRKSFSLHAGKAFPACGTGFLRIRKGVFRHSEKVFMKCGTGFSAQQMRLTRHRNESICAFYTLQMSSRSLFFQKIM